MDETKLVLITHNNANNYLNNEKIQNKIKTINKIVTIFKINQAS